MNRFSKKTSIAGALYLIGTVAGILSIAPAVDAPDYLIKAAANANQVLLGALFQFIMTIAYAGFAISLYPVLKAYKEDLALGFLCFRMIAVALNMIGFICLLLLLWVSQSYVKAGTPDPSYFPVIGDLLRSGRDFVNHVAMILILGAGNLLFYSLLYRARLVPGWMSLWGLLGTGLTMVASLLVMFQVTGIITTTYITLNLPLILVEILLAVWLIARGFDPPRPVSSGPPVLPLEI